MIKQLCNVCGNRTFFSKVIQLKNPRKDLQCKYFEYYRCNTCDGWILKPELSGTDLNKIYTKAYYTELSESLPNPIINSLISFQVATSYEDFVGSFLDDDIKHTLLDIGVGKGEFLDKMKKKGLTVFGLDPYIEAVKRLQGKKGIKKVYHGTIESLCKTKQSFSLITMWHVLEHVDKPLSDVKMLNAKLLTKGKLFFEVPNADSLSLTMFKESYCWYMVPEHAYYFNSKSLKILLGKSGFSLLRLYSPPKALLNFSFSLKQLCETKYNLNKKLCLLVFLATMPISIVVTFIASLLNKGEVIRVAAIKN